LQPLADQGRVRLYSYTPRPNCWKVPLFHETEFLFFLCWAALVRHRLPLKGVLVQDSFVEKAPYFQSLVKTVGKTCLKWIIILVFYRLLSLTCMWVWIHIMVHCRMQICTTCIFRTVQSTSKYFGATAQISTVTSKHMKLTWYSFYGRRKRTEF
jgi:hypothetical protein